MTLKAIIGIYAIRVVGIDTQYSYEFDNCNNDANGNDRNLFKRYCDDSSHWNTYGWNVVKRKGHEYHNTWCPPK